MCQTMDRIGVATRQEEEAMTLFSNLPSSQRYFLIYSGRNVFSDIPGSKRSFPTYPGPEKWLECYGPHVG